MGRYVDNHAEYEGSHTQSVTEQREFINYSCRYCERTFSAPTELGTREIEDYVATHMKSQHPEKL